MMGLLETNDAPRDSDISVIQQTISAAEDRLRALDAQIHPLQTTLAQLLQRRAEVAEHLREHRAVLSPVRRVPPELICEIFDMATAQSRATKSPWWTGFISQPWRQYALAYPPLWSYLTVPASPWDERTARLPALRTQLLRSGPVPLDICWSEVDSRSPDSRTLDLLLPYSNSWRSLSFIVKYNAVLEWLEPVRGKLDRLERLDILHNLCPFPDVFTTAPNLRHVGLPPFGPSDNGSLQRYCTFISIPWQQITHYRGQFPFSQHLAILRAAPNLSNCTLDMVETSDFIPVPNTIITLPQLRRLCLDRAGFLLHIVAPNLEELCSLRSTWVIPRILPFVWQASCTLQRLVLWHCPLSTELTAALRDLPSLTYLLLHNDHHNESDGFAFFTTMRVSGMATDICPRLATLVYGFVHWEGNASQESFFRMARTRLRTNRSVTLPSGTNLSSLRLLSCNPYLDNYLPPDAKIKARVQLLRNEGFNVAFLGEGETAEYLRCRKL
ncbi:hypothetical protein C8R45DRAFT_1178714 [Mycena sanguinolenta]|nr:hypothetical protein C8R45DRAFT_1178714 [Mycena sanguinolenta]